MCCEKIMFCELRSRQSEINTFAFTLSGNKLARHLVVFQELLTIIIHYYFHFDVNVRASHISNTTPTIHGITCGLSLH